MRTETIDTSGVAEGEVRIGLCDAIAQADGILHRADEVTSRLVVI